MLDGLVNTARIAEGHSDGGDTEPVVAQVTVDFLNRYLAGQSTAAAAMTRAGNLAGVATLVTGRRPPP